ncbi:hypothetical protein HY972_01370 [Candidatus Kaiserbacteria bacterium]|nr:hypothetical protein [Candidatus Kaiserbacteria bacterium]
MKSITRSVLSAIALLTPSLALAVTVVGGANSGGGWFFGIGSGGNGAGFCVSTICGVATTILYLINSVLVPVLFAVAFIVFLYGVARAYIFSVGDADKVAEGHKLILWGIIGFVVMISLWGIVNVVANTFGLWGYGAPRFPTSY